MQDEELDQLDPDSPIVGIMDSVGAGSISGWVADRRDHARRIRVDLTLDGKYITTVSACLYRHDLTAAGFTDAFHGFHFPLPPECLDSFGHILEARVGGTGQHLTRSPLDALPWNLRNRLRSPTVDARFGPNPVRLPDRQVPRLPRKKKASEFVPSGRSLAPEALNGISVVMPTFNRGALLEAALLESFACTEGCPVEFIIVDVGSTDDTPERLARLAATHPELRYISIANGGPGRARNLGVELASYEVVLFQGDDVRPAHSAFYRLHLEAHRRLPFVGVAVLGKVVWPQTPDFEITFPMRHIQGKGQQQFGYYSLLPYTWVDWRFFYTSNVSLKKQVVSDWREDGFSSSFRDPAWEDGELAYRLSEQHPGGFGTLYIPGPVGEHYHRYGTRSFIERQLSTGRAAQVFSRKHPNLRRKIGLDVLERLLTSPATPKDLATPRADLLSMIEALQAWPCLLEAEGTLGQEDWHDNLLRGVFNLSYFEGYILANEYPYANYDAAYRYLIEQFQSAVHTPLMFEVFGRTPPFAAIPHLPAA